MRIGTRFTTCKCKPVALHNEVTFFEEDGDEIFGVMFEGTLTPERRDRILKAGLEFIAACANRDNKFELIPSHDDRTN